MLPRPRRQAAFRPRSEASHRRLVKAKKEDLKIYKSGNEEQYEEIDKLLEEYIYLEEASTV